MISITTNMPANQLIKGAAQAVLAAYALTTVHHLYGGVVDDIPGRLFVPVVLAVPLVIALGALYVYERTASAVALRLFSLVAVLVFVIASGVVHGGYAHTYKDILFLFNGPSELYYPLNPDEHYPPDNLFFELTGIAEMVTAYFVALFTFRLVRNRSASSGK